MWQDDILLMTNAQFIIAILTGDIGKRAHLLSRGITRGRAMFFQRDGDTHMIAVLMRGH